MSSSAHSVIDDLLLDDLEFISDNLPVLDVSFCDECNTECFTYQIKLCNTCNNSFCPDCFLSDFDTICYDCFTQTSQE
jgi:hypothetical protein